MELDDLALSLVELRQLVQRSIQEQQLAIARMRRADAIVERHSKRRVGSFGGATRARVINKDAPHHLRGDAEEVRPALPAHPLCAGQSEMRLVHQQGGLKRACAPFVMEIIRSASLEVSIHQRQ